MRAKRLVILGAGGMARETLWLIEEINRQAYGYEFLGFIVGDLSSQTGCDSRERVLGDEAWLAENHNQFDSLVLGVGDPQLRLAISRRMQKQFPDAEWPTLVHPSVIYDRASCEFRPGSQICAGVICTTNVDVGAFALLNLSSSVGHDARIGSGCVVNPGANISGGVLLEDGVLVGTGAQVLQYKKVGAGAVIGAGAVVIDDVPPRTTVVGIPARPK